MPIELNITIKEDNPFSQMSDLYLQITEFQSEIASFYSKNKETQFSAEIWNKFAMLNAYVGLLLIQNGPDKLLTFLEYTEKAGSNLAKEKIKELETDEYPKKSKN